MKKDLSKYIALVEFRIQGIPCLLGVVDYSKVKGSYSYNADSDWDYHGYIDCDYEILDRKGYPAAWLERKGHDEGDAYTAIEEYFDDQDDDY